MTKSTLLVGPFNRVEGDLELKLDVSDGQVVAAYANSPMFRGFERIMLGKEPLDALTITPRICGICSISQSAAAAFALADAIGQPMAPEAEKVAALLHAVENIADHVTHFYMFFMPDFAREGYAGRSWHSEAVNRFTAGKGSSLRRAIDARAQLLHIVGMLGGKWPHTLAIQPGGVTRAPSARDLIRISTSLRAFRRFLETHLFGAKVEDFIELVKYEEFLNWSGGDVGLFVEISEDLHLRDAGVGPGRYMSFGAYPTAIGPIFKRGLWRDGTVTEIDFTTIREDLSHAWMLGDSAHPSAGETLPDTQMSAHGYSWCKAPRLDGQTVEVGAFARQIIDGHPLALSMANSGGVCGRIVGRLLEIARTQIVLENIVASINPNASFMEKVHVPDDGVGVGLVEAARGSLGHWLRIKDGKIAAYQIIAPTTWNFSPRDSSGTPGPVETALVGAHVEAGEATPLMVQHIVRSFDPCMVCTVH